MADVKALGAPYTDIRIPRPWRWQWTFPDALPGLVSVQFHPPRATDSDEIELTFGTAEGAEAADETFLCSEIERVTTQPVLASRRRAEAR